MEKMRMAIGPHFSIERRRLDCCTIAATSQTNFLLIYLLGSQSKGLATGTCLLTNPHEVTPSNADQSDVLIVRLTPQLLIEMASRLQLHRGGSQLLFRRSITDDKRLAQLMEAIAAELIVEAAGWGEMLASLVQQLAIYLLRTHINVQRADELELSRVGVVDRRLRRAVEFMHDNCDRELQLAEIARAAYLSAFHFARLFKKLTGATPRAYLASLRIERARRLLVETDLSISEVGACVGYESQSHFTKLFREATGLTPRAFRTIARYVESD